MRFQKILTALFVCCLLFLTGCSQTDITVSAERLEGFFEDIGESFSVRSLEKSNRNFFEPEYITWQTARHYYDDLSEKEKLAYRCIYNDIFGRPERISVPMLDADELNAVFTALRYDNPQLLFLGDEATLLTAGLYCYFVPVYTMSYWDARTAIENAVACARRPMNLITQNADDYEVLLSLHDALCDLCIYSETQNASQCHGALLDGAATCAGYAKALKLMLDLAGIDSCVVTGSVSEGGDDINHMWLAVCLNGTWCFCDPTWDDPVAEDGTQSIEHGYLAVSASYLSLTHSDIQLPSHITCDSDAYDYYRMEYLFCTQENYRSVIADGIALALQGGEKFVEFRFDSAATLQAASEVLFDGSEIYTLLADAVFLNENLQVNRIGYSVNEKQLLLKLIFAFDEQRE